jgi:hypothetical protein
MEQGFQCFKCGGGLSPEYTGRRDSCPKCNSDVHVCKNCTFYDPKAYNECHEIQAERVVDKERSNYCDYFKPRSGGIGASGPSADDVLKKLDDLFKK